MIFKLKIFRDLFSHLHFRIIFVIRVPHITATYCLLHRHALAATSLPEKLEKIHTSKGGSEVEPVRKFCGQGGMGSIFRDSCMTSFMDGHLALAINISMCNLHIVLNYITVNKNIQVTC